MSEDQIFSTVAMSALLLWLLARMQPPERRVWMERIAYGLIGVGILVALVMTINQLSA